jgi:hypothetical protein
LSDAIEFHRKRIVLRFGSLKAFSEQIAFLKQDKLGHGNEACAFASTRQTERHCEAKSRRGLSHRLRHIGISRTKCLRTK